MSVFEDLTKREGASSALGGLTGLGASSSAGEEGLTSPLDLGGKGDPASLVSRELGLRTPGEATEDVSGITAANAAAEAARLQEEFAREALTEQDISQRRLEETLAPFVQFGTGLIPSYEGLFQGDVASSAAASPNITDLTAFADQLIMDNPAINPNARSILDTGALLNAPNLLSRERGDLLSALGLGQASAAQQAAGGLQTGQNRVDLLTQIGNVQAAGGIGQAQALGQGANNIVGLGTTLAQQFGGK